MTMTSTNYQIIFRHKKYNDSLSGCFVWAPNETQAEKKFKARKEFDYNPEYDRDPDEGNIRSIYEYKEPKKKGAPNKLTVLEKFVRLPKFYNWLKKYDAGEEVAIAKGIPLTDENKTIIDQIAKVIPIIRRYRGPRLRGGLMRECHKQDAERVSIYGRVK